MANAVLNYLFGRKKSTPEVVTNVISEETHLLYLKSEFQCIGDMLKDNFLRKEEFLRLMALLGYPGDTDEVESIWNACVPAECGMMTMEEYIAIMSNDGIREKTDTWRKLFAQFDTNGNGFASKSDFIQGMKNMGVTITPELRAKLKAMDTNKDKKISYGEFLKQQLQQ